MEFVKTARRIKMKTLVVSYLPRGERSNTKKLVNEFLKNIETQEVEHLELTQEVPDLLMPDNLLAYTKRNYGGEQLNDEDQKLLEKMDRMTEQFIGADIVVLAFPMYNFSMPATVKAYFDSITLKGKTWDITEKGMIGLMNGKRALILMTRGGIYEGENKGMEHAISLSRSLFEFMGFDDVEDVVAQGTNMSSNKIEEILEKSNKEIKEIIKRWYI
jgi:FMN-dependent NADH-azoreductase